SFSGFNFNESASIHQLCQFESVSTCCKNLSLKVLPSIVVLRSIALDIRICEGKKREITVKTRKKTIMLIMPSLITLMLFPFKNSSQNQVNDDHPHSQYTQLPSAICNMQSLKRDLSQRIIVLCQRKQPAYFL